jgi:hypothetical protein
MIIGLSMIHALCNSLQHTVSLLWLHCWFPKSKSKLCYDRRSFGQSVLVSRPICGPRPDFCYCETVAGLLTWGVFSHKKTGLLFTFAAGPSRVRVTRDSWPYYTGSYSRLPGTGWPSFTPGHWVPFSSPSTTREATMEIFESAPTL